MTNLIRNFILTAALIGTLAVGLMVGKAYTDTINAAMQQRVQVYNAILE